MTLHGCIKYWRKLLTSLRRLRNEHQADAAHNSCNEEFDNEQPPPGCDASPGAHGLNSVREQSAECARDALGEIRRHNALSRLLLGIYGRKHERESGRQSRFASAQYHPKHDGLRVTVDERRGQRAGTP